MALLRAQLLSEASQSLDDLRKRLEMGKALSRHFVVVSYDIDELLVKFRFDFLYSL